MAERIQMKRTKGWRKPEGAVYVGRPTKWGNPFKVSEVVERDDPRFAYMCSVFPALNGLVSAAATSRQAVVMVYDRWLCEQPALMLSARDELGGRDLACWCPLDQPCHADVLLELANA